MPVKSLTAFSMLVALMLGLSSGASAQSGPTESAIQSLAAVRREAVAAVRREIDPAITGITLDAAELDSRLRLPACSGPLSARATLPRGTQARVLVRVACNGDSHWNLSVPVDIHRKADVLVMRRAVPRGESIGAADVIVQARVLPGLATPYVSRVADLAGRLTRRPVPEGAALSADALDAALLIHRGQNVTLAVNAAGFEVRAPGVALANAAANQRVRVRNLNSLKVVEGVADTAGVVRLIP